MKKQVLKADQAKKKTLIADIRRPVRKLLDHFLTIGPFSSSETMQDNGEKTGKRRRNAIASLTSSKSR